MYIVYKDFIVLLIYLFLSISTVGLLGWLIYDKIFLKDISLRKELFENDSVAAWLEFIGGFLAPAFFLASIIMSPTGRFVFKGEWKDLITSIIYISIYIIIFSMFRFAGDKIIGIIGTTIFKEKISLKAEIYKQSNIAAALFSISVSIIVIGMLLQENILNESLLINLVKIGLVFVISIGLLSVYKTFFFPKNVSLFKEVFIDNNISSGLLFLGNTIAINFIIYYSIDWFKISSSGWLKISNIFDAILFICFIYLIMIVTVSITKLAVNKILKINIDHELFVQNNIGYALLESSFYILISVMIINGLLIK